MTFLSLILFVVAGAGTPGPNNTIVMASGAAFGFRKTVAAVAGINIGFPVMIVLVGLGLGGLLTQFPFLLDIIRPLGVAYLLWLAWRIATGPTDLKARREGRPPGFVQMALFQFVNPKAWTLALAALSTFTGFWDSFLLEVLVIAGIAGLFNLVMAALLVVSVVPAIMETWESIQLLLQ